MEKSDASNSAGLRFREAMKKEKPLQIVGAVNAQHALLAGQAGFNAIYLSGGGVAAGSLDPRALAPRRTSSSQSIATAPAGSKPEAHSSRGDQ